MSVETTLEERGTRYGKFDGHAAITQTLKDVLRTHEKWASLSASQKEALEMVMHKVGRIMNGDPSYVDNWHDIAGYATLVEKELNVVEERAADKEELFVEGYNADGVILWSQLRSSFTLRDAMDEFYRTERLDRIYIDHDIFYTRKQHEAYAQHLSQLNEAQAQAQTPTITIEGSRLRDFLRGL